MWGIFNALFYIIPALPWSQNNRSSNLQTCYISRQNNQYSKCPLFIFQTLLDESLNFWRWKLRVIIILSNQCKILLQKGSSCSLWNNALCFKSPKNTKECYSHGKYSQHFKRLLWTTMCGPISVSRGWNIFSKN